MNKKRPTFLGRMVLAYSTLLGALLFILINVAYQYIVDIGEKTAIIQQQQLMERAVSQVDGYFDEMSRMARNVSADNRVVSLFRELQENRGEDNYFETSVFERVNFRSILTSLKGPDSSLCLSVFNQYGEYVSSEPRGIRHSGLSKSLRGGEAAQLMQELLQASTDGLLLYPASDGLTGSDDEYRSATFFYPVTNYYKTEIYGVAEVWQDISILEDTLVLDPSTGITVFLFNEHGDQVLPFDKSFTEINSSQFFTTQAKSEKYGWNIALVQSRERLTEPYRSVTGYLYIFAFGILAIMILMVYLIARQFTNPITELRDKVRGIRVGSIPASLVTVQGTDEIRELSQAFTALLNKLGDSVEYEKKSYLLALQSQMDPHFLFNSLSVISSMGVEAGSEKIVEVCGMLGAMLSYSTSYDTRGITLQDEIDNAKNYLEMMKLRFEYQFSYTIDVDRSLSGISMPKLVLQPILENCFEHGFKQQAPPWEIAIRAYKAGGDWVISISDNGVGFLPESLERLNERVSEYSENLPDNYHEMKLGGLGLVNTIIRMRLSMGGPVTYEIGKNGPAGTIITLRGSLL